MTSNRRAFHRHARTVVDHELRRARGRLTTMPRRERLAVEEVSARVAAALVDELLDRARGDPLLARALASIYGPEPAWQPRAVSCARD
jgi:hypothetical protein